MFDNLVGRKFSYHQQTNQLTASGGCTQIPKRHKRFSLHSKNSALINFYQIFPIFHPSRTAKSWIMREIFIHSATQSREKWMFLRGAAGDANVLVGEKFPFAVLAPAPTHPKLWYAFYGAYKRSMKFYSPNLCSSIASNDLKGFRGRKHISVGCLSKSWSSNSFSHGKAT